MSGVRRVVRGILLFTLIVFSLYFVVYFVTEVTRKEVLDCGVVESKSTDEVTIKHGVETELYLNVRFEKFGFRSIKCDPTTFFSKKKGDRVCFSLDDPKHKPNVFIMAVGAFIIGASILVIVIGAIAWVLELD